MNPSSCPYFKFNCWVYGTTALVLVLAALSISKGQDVIWINSRHTLFLNAFMIFITQLGAGLLFLPLLIALLFVRLRYSLLTLSIWIGHGIICAILKRSFFGYLKRPKELLGNDLLYFVPNVDVHSFFSFPSGHTATIFCLAFLLSLLIRKRIASFVFLLIALLVAYSRIYLLQHFLVDVAGGAVIAVVVTYLLWNYFERATLPGWMNHHLKINPNFSLRLTS